VEKDHWGAGGPTDFRVTDAEDAGIYLLQLAEHLRASGLHTLGATSAKPCTSHRYGGHAQEPAAMAVDLFMHVLNPSDHQAVTSCAYSSAASSQMKWPASTTCSSL
jgi:hypothetical protein